MNVASFVPVVAEILPDEAPGVPGLGAVVSHWTEGTRSPEDWFREVNDRFGTAGFAVRRGEEVCGFAVYGPRADLPRAGRYPVGPLDEDAVLLAYVGGDARTRRRLLVRVLRDLRSRGIERVEAIASDRETPHHPHTRFLVESGWRPVRRVPSPRGFYTLVRTDLASAVEVRGMARALVGRVKLPGLRTPGPIPGALSRAVRTAGTRRDG